MTHASCDFGKERSTSAPNSSSVSSRAIRRAAPSSPPTSPPALPPASASRHLGSSSRRRSAHAVYLL